MNNKNYGLPIFIVIIVILLIVTSAIAVKVINDENNNFLINNNYPENSYTGIAMMFKTGWIDGKPIGFMVNAETKSFQYYAAFDTTGYNRIVFSIFYFLKG